jgi:hypothetical protein
LQSADSCGPLPAVRKLAAERKLSWVANRQVFFGVAVEPFCNATPFDSTGGFNRTPAVVFTHCLFRKIGGILDGLGVRFGLFVSFSHIVHPPA